MKTIGRTGIVAATLLSLLLAAGCASNSPFSRCGGSPREGHSWQAALATLMDSSTSFTDFARAADALPRGAKGDRWQLWTKIANNAAYAGPQRQRAVLELFKRHVHPSMTLWQLANRLDNPTWLVKGAVSIEPYSGLGGPRPVGNADFPGTMLVVSVSRNPARPDKYDDGWVDIHLLVADFFFLEECYRTPMAEDAVFALLKERTCGGLKSMSPEIHLALILEIGWHKTRGVQGFYRWWTRPEEMQGLQTQKGPLRDEKEQERVPKHGRMRQWNTGDKRTGKGER